MVSDCIPNKDESAQVDIESTAVDALESLRSSPAGPSPEPSASAKPTEGVASSSDTIMSSDSSTEKPALTMEDFVEIEKAHYTFPERLMELLEEGEAETAMWWLPGGSAFAIRSKVFYEDVLSKHFQGTKFESFTRKLNRWGFRRLASQCNSQSTIAYYHKMFKKGQPDLVKNMRSGKKGRAAEAIKTVPATAPPTLKAQAPPVSEVANTAPNEPRSLREYLRAQSIMAARQTQQVASLEKDHGLLAAMGLQANATRSMAPVNSAANLLNLQRRARMMEVERFAAERFAGANGPASMNGLGSQFFSQLGLGLLEPAVSPLALGELMSPQVIQLMLLRERMGQSGMRYA